MIHLTEIVPPLQPSLAIPGKREDSKVSSGHTARIRSVKNRRYKFEERVLRGKVGVGRVREFGDGRMNVMDVKFFERQRRS